MTSVQTTLSERGKTYGSFRDVADISDAICKAIERPDYSTVQSLALSNIAMKLARIANGDPNHVDSWHDIAGYATLAADDLRANS